MINLNSLNNHNDLGNLFDATLHKYTMSVVITTQHTDANTVLPKPHENNKAVFCDHFRIKPRKHPIIYHKLTDGLHKPNSKGIVKTSLRLVSTRKPKVIELHSEPPEATSQKNDDKDISAYENNAVDEMSIALVLKELNTSPHKAHGYAKDTIKNNDMDSEIQQPTTEQNSIDSHITTTVNAQVEILEQGKVPLHQNVVMHKTTPQYTPGPFQKPYAYSQTLFYPTTIQPLHQPLIPHMLQQQAQGRNNAQNKSNPYITIQQPSTTYQLPAQRTLPNIQQTQVQHNSAQQLQHPPPAIIIKEYPICYIPKDGTTKIHSEVYQKSSRTTTLVNLGNEYIFVQFLNNVRIYCVEDRTQVVNPLSVIQQQRNNTGITIPTNKQLHAKLAISSDAMICSRLEAKAPALALGISEFYVTFVKDDIHDASSIRSIPQCYRERAKLLDELLNSKAYESKRIINTTLKLESITNSSSFILEYDNKHCGHACDMIVWTYYKPPSQATTIKAVLCWFRNCYMILSGTFGNYKTRKVVQVY